MTHTSEILLRSVLIGVGATLTMDLWAAVLRRFGIASLSFALLGRWIGHIAQGRWFHQNIARAVAVRGELWIGWLSHYAIGVSFALLLLTTFGLEWARTPTFLPALSIGIVTVLAPWFVLQPAFGAGIASSKTPRPLFNAVKSLLTHTVFGVGLFLAGHATAALVFTNH